MNDADVRQRLDAVMRAIGVPSVARPSLAGDDARDGTGAQRIATIQIDELLRRVAALTDVIGAGGRRAWDDVDRIAAQLLLADLAVIASTARALNELAAARLTSAIEDLVAAQRDVEHTLQEEVL
jgi:ribosomal protein S13